MVGMESKKFATKLRSMMERRNLNQGRMAKILGIRPATISKWNTGDSDPSYDNLFHLARALGCSVDYLMFDEIERPSPADNATEERLLASIRTMGYAEAERRLLQVPPVVLGPTMPAPPASDYGGKFGGQVHETTKPKVGRPSKPPVKKKRTS